MKENSKHINILVCALVCLLVIVCSTLLYSPSGGTEERIKVQAEEEKEVQKGASAEAVAEDVQKPTGYTLRLEAELLKFYLNSEGGTVLLEEAPINSDVYPKKDIEALSAGVTVTTLEEGIGIIEDFTS